MAEISPFPFGKDELAVYLSDLDNELDHEVELITIGGAAVALMWDSRQTTDMDVVNKELTPSLEAAIARVGLKHGTGRQWLNNESALMGAPLPTGPVRAVFSGTNLKVVLPDMEYLLASKLKAGRTKDRYDTIRMTMNLGLYETGDLVQFLKASQFARNYYERPEEIETFCKVIAEDAQKLRLFRVTANELSSMNDAGLRDLLRRASTHAMMVRAEQADDAR